MNDLNVKVGDRVISCYLRGFTPFVGTVVKITEKRKDIVVDYGRFKGTYSSDGWEKGSDNWFNRSYIKVLTPEIEKQLREDEIIRTCRDAFEKKDLTFEQAEKILKILEVEGAKE